MRWPRARAISYIDRMSRRILMVFAFAAFARCGTVVDHHIVTLSVNDPSHRLGAAVEGVIVERTSHELLEREATKRLTRLPLRDEVTGTRVVAGLSAGDAPTVTFGVIIPKLSPDGYFLFELAPEKGVEKTAQAPLVRFGQYFADAGAMSVPVRFTGRTGERGWLLDVTIDVPPQ